MNVNENGRNGRGQEVASLPNGKRNAKIVELGRVRVFMQAIKVWVKGEVKPITAVSKVEAVAAYKAYEMKETLFGTLGTVIDDKVEQIETNNQHCEICLTLPPEYVKKLLSSEVEE